MPLSCSIQTISWERVHLRMTLRLDGSVDFINATDADPSAAEPEPIEHPVALGVAALGFALQDDLRQLPLQSQRVDETTHLIEINVTGFPPRRQVPNGTWRLVVTVDGDTVATAHCDMSLLEEIDNHSRVFLYDHNQSAYTVSFGISESDTYPDFLMRTYQLFRKRGPKPKKSRLKRIKNTVRDKKKRARRRLVNAWYRLARRVNPPTGDRILFSSELRQEIEGNLLRIRDRMVERGLDNEFEFRYSFRTPRTGSRPSALRTVYLLATSDIVLIDDYFGMLEWLHLSPDTKLVQVWHAGSGFKSVGFSRFGKYGSPKLQNAHRKYTYAITGSKNLVPVYAEAFGIEESAVIPTGLPRIDTFLDPARTEEVIAGFYRTYPHLRGKKIILFAPTFRGRGIRDAHYDYSRIDFAQLFDTCGDDTVVLFRMHHFIHAPVPIPPQYQERLLDFSGFQNTNDLLHVTDLLITDYSSIIYEFALLNRPMLFFAYDKDIYSATRGFHRNYDQTAPGKVCVTFDEVTRAICDEDFDTWKIESFRAHNFDNIDTKSADRVIDWLILRRTPPEQPGSSDGVAASALPAVATSLTMPVAQIHEASIPAQLMTTSSAIEDKASR